MSAQVPGMPPVVVQGSMVAYTGQAAVDTHQLMGLALKVLREQAARTGVNVPARFELLAAAARSAAEATTSGPDIPTFPDVGKHPISASWGSAKWVGVDTVSEMFGVGERQAQRICEVAGGVKTPKGWRIQDTQLRAHHELRRTA